MTPRRQLPAALLLLLLPLLACTHDADPIPSALAAAPAPRSVDYHLDLHPRYASVRIDVRRPATASWRLTPPPALDPGQRWYDLQATDAKGAPLTIERRDDAFIVSNAAEQDFSVRYLVIDQRQAYSDGGDPRAPLTTHQTFLALGSALFLAPDDRAQQPYDEARFHIDGHGWPVATTWGSRDARLDDARTLWSGLVTGGDLTLHRRKIQRSALFVAVDPQLGVDAEAWADRLEQLAQTQANFFRNYPLNALMAALAQGPGGDVTAVSEAGGILILAPHDWADPADPRVLHVVAREHFRMFSERWMRPRAHDDEITPFPAWFVHGAAAFYATRTLLLLKLLDGDAFVRILNTWIRDYYTNRWAFADLPDANLATSWEQPDAARLAIAKGALLTLLIDVTLRTESLGGTTFDQVLQRLGFDFGGADAGYTGDDLKSSVQRFSRRDWDDFFNRHVAGHEPMPLAYLDRAGILMTTAPGQRFDPGFTIEATDDPNTGARWRVSAVEPDSPAARAGLTDGDLLADLTIASDRVEVIRLLKPPTDAEDDSSQARLERAPLTFSPLRHADIPQATQTTEIFEDWFRTPL